MTRKEARSQAGDFDRMNEDNRRHVRDVPPARATVQVSALSSGALVEIAAVALAS